MLECKREVISNTISYYKSENNKLKIFYLNNELYTSFTHPSISYYIAEYICYYLKVEKYHAKLIAIIQLVKDDLSNDDIIDKLFE